jgi:cytochrome b subunit of formate dehydrogenase
MALAEIEERVAEAPHQESFVRFSRWQRIEHWLLVLSFATLLLTGLPQKYDDAALSASIMDLLGSVSNARFLHRVAACVFVAESVVHAGEIGLSMLKRRFRPTMLITPQDFRDAVNMLRYSVGLIPDKPRFDRYDYRQKFEYWGILFGAVIMIGTGAVLGFPVAVTRVLPGELVPVAKETHSGEALLAMLVVLLWHFYDVIFSPAVLPLDTAMITGKISRERLMHEHRKEFDRLGLSTDANPPMEDAASPAFQHSRAPPRDGS